MSRLLFLCVLLASWCIDLGPRDCTRYVIGYYRVKIEESFSSSALSPHHPNARVRVQRPRSTLLPEAVLP